MKKLNIFKRLYYKTKIRLCNFFKYRNNRVYFKLKELYSNRKEKDVDIRKEKDVYIEPYNILKQELTLEQLKYFIDQYNMVKNYKNSKQYKKDSERLKRIRGCLSI